jgi:hypothetical protein
MKNYEKFLPRLNTQVELLRNDFFSCDELLKKL